MLLRLAPLVAAVDPDDVPLGQRITARSPSRRVQVPVSLHMHTHIGILQIVQGLTYIHTLRAQSTHVLMDLLHGS